MLSSKSLKMINVVGIFILTTFCALTASCSKEETISIPKRLSGSEWSMWTEEYTAWLKFTSESQCVYSETTTDGITSEYHYSYTYEKPNLSLTPVDKDRELLSGYIEKASSKSIVMKIYTPSGKDFFEAWNSVLFDW